MAEESTSVMAAAGAALNNLVAALPDVSKDLIAAKTAQAAADAQAAIAKSQASAAKSQAAAAASQAETAQLTLAQKLAAGAKAQAPWLIPVVVAGAAAAIYFFFIRKKSQS